MNPSKESTTQKRENIEKKEYIENAWIHMISSEKYVTTSDYVLLNIYKILMSGNNSLYFRLRFSGCLFPFGFLFVSLALSLPFMGRWSSQKERKNESKEKMSFIYHSIHLFCMVFVLWRFLVFSCRFLLANNVNKMHISLCTNFFSAFLQVKWKRKRKWA